MQICDSWANSGDTNLTFLFSVRSSTDPFSLVDHDHDSRRKNLWGESAGSITIRFLTSSSARLLRSS
jgi:hypothetical protein